MGNIASHRDLIVWKKSIDLAVLVYPSVKNSLLARYRLVSQMTRSAASVRPILRRAMRRQARKIIRTSSPLRRLLDGNGNLPDAFGSTELSHRRRSRISFESYQIAVD